jgi:hypothetical protein
VVQLYADSIVSAFYSYQEVQFGSMNFVRVAFADMFSPVIAMTGPSSAANIFNSTFVRISEPLEGTAEEKSLVIDPVKTNKVYGDSVAAANITIPIKPRGDVPPGLFITEEDVLFKQLQQVRVADSSTYKVVDWDRKSVLMYFLSSKHSQEPITTVRMLLLTCRPQGLFCSK